MPHDPRVPEQFPPALVALLSAGQHFSYHGGIIKYETTARHQTVTGPAYVAKFTVKRPDPDREWVTPPTHHMSEYLAACAIEANRLEPHDGDVPDVGQQTLSEATTGGFLDGNR